MMMLKLTTPAPPKEGNFHTLAPFEGLATTERKKHFPAPFKGGTLFVIFCLFEAFIGGYP